MKTTTNFKIHYTLEEGHIHETTVDFVNKIANGFELSFAILRGFGYCATEKPTSKPLYNDGFYHVFVVSLGNAGAMEPTKTLEGSIIFIGTALQFSDESRFLSLCGHEYYHAIQMTYIKSYTIGADGNLVWYPQVKRWVDEGTAEWVEHEIFRTQFPDGDWKQHDQVSEFQENVNDYLEKPYKGLESWKHGALPLWFFMVDNSRINFKGGGQQRDLILDFWDLMGYDFDKLTGYAAWGNVYENFDMIFRGIWGENSEYGSFDKVFTLFVQSNYFKDVETEGLTPWYAKNGTFTRDMFEGGPLEIKRVNKKQMTLSKDLPVSVSSLSLNSATAGDLHPLENYSCWYFEIKNDTKSARQIKVTLSGDQSMFLVAFEDAGDERSKTIVDKKSNSTHICIQKGKTALVMVGRLGGGHSKDYTLKIDNMHCQPKDRNPDKSGENCKRLDLIFVIDVTGSMADDIDAVKKSAETIVNTIESMICDFRVGIVAYRDHPVYPYGNPGDPMFEDYAFSDNTETIINNINALSVYGGADWPEAVYDALLRACECSSIGGWRDGVDKVIVLMGDAPPHVPCPFHGYTAKHVIEAAYNVDPAIIYSVCVGSDSYTLEAFREISEGTGGEVFTALTAEDVVQALLQAVGSAIAQSGTVEIEPVSGVVLDLPPPDYNEMMRPLALENIKKAQDLHTDVENLVESIMNQGKQIPEEVKTLIDLAETYLARAEYYNTSGNYVAANYWAIQAQEQFKEAIQSLENFKSNFFLFL